MKERCDWRAVLRSIHRSTDPTTTFFTLILPYDQLFEVIQDYANRAVLALPGSSLAGDIEKMLNLKGDEHEITLVSHFVYLATSITHIFTNKGRLRSDATILPYQAPNIPAPYIWFNLNENDDQYVQLVKHIVPQEGYFRLQIEVGEFVETNSYVMSSGVRMKCVRFNENELLRIAMDFESQKLTVLKSNPRFAGCCLLFTLSNRIVGVFLNLVDEVRVLSYILH